MVPHDLHTRIHDRLGQLEALVQTLAADLVRLQAALPSQATTHRQQAEDCAAGVRADLAELARLAERELPTWHDRPSLEGVLQDLLASCRQREIEAQREKLRAVAEQLRAGELQHKLPNRKRHLEGLREQAVEQLLGVAGREQPLPLPGPQTGDWPTWAWNLPESELQTLVESLQADLPGLVDFLGECAREWWQSSVREAPREGDASREGEAPREGDAPAEPGMRQPEGKAPAEPDQAPTGGQGSCRAEQGASPRAAVEREEAPGPARQEHRPTVVAERPSSPEPQGRLGGSLPLPDRQSVAEVELSRSPDLVVGQGSMDGAAKPQAEDIAKPQAADIAKPQAVESAKPQAVESAKPQAVEREEVPSPAAPQETDEPIDLSTIADLPDELKTFRAFTQQHWLKPPLGEVCSRVPWSAPDFAEHLAAAFKQAIAAAARDPAHLGRAWLFARALESMDLLPQIDSRSLAHLAALWAAPRSLSSGRDPDRIARIRQADEPGWRGPAGEAFPESVLRLLLFLEAVRPSPEDGLTVQELAAREREHFHHPALRDTVRALLELRAQSSDPLARLRTCLDESPAGVDSRQELDRKRSELGRKRQTLYTEYIRIARNAGNGYVGRFDFCQKAWAEFLDEVTPEVRPLFPVEPGNGKGTRARGEQEWNPTTKAAWIETIAVRHTAIADRYGAHDRARRIMDRAAESLADHLREVNNAYREVQELLHNHHVHHKDESLPIAEIRKLLQMGTPLSAADEELCRRTLAHLLQPPEQTSDPFVVPAELLLAHPDLVALLADWSTAGEESDPLPPRFDGFSEPVRAAAVLLSEPVRETPGAEAPGLPLDRLAVWLQHHRRFHLLGRLMTRLAPDDQRAAHKQRDEAMFRVQAERGRLYRVWREFDDRPTLLSVQAATLRHILEEVDQLTSDRGDPESGETRSVDPTLLLEWLSRVVHESERCLRRLLAGLEQALAQSASEGEGSLLALEQQRFKEAIRPPSEQRAAGRRAWRETPWRTEAASRYPNPRSLLMQQDLDLARDWVQRFPQPPHHALRSLRASFTRWAFGGDTPSSLNKRAGGKGDNREYRLPCAGIREFLAAGQPTFLPQLADFASLVVLTSPVLPESHDFVGRTADLINNQDHNDLCILLAPGIAANTRLALLERIRRRRGACTAVLDDLDLCRLLNPGNESAGSPSSGRASEARYLQRPDAIVGLLELAFEQQSWTRLTPFTAPGGDQMRLEVYVGRREEAEHLARTGKYTRLFSGRKLGKTALLKFLEQTWDGRELSSGQRLRVIYLPIVGVRAESDLIHQLIAEMRKRFSFDLARPEDEDGIGLAPPPRGYTPEVLVEFLLRFVDERPDESLLFVLDEADEFVLAQLEEYERRYEACLSFQMRSQISGARIDAAQRPRVRFVFSGYRATATYGGPWAHWGDVLQLVPLLPEEAADLVAGPLARLGIDAAEQADAVAFRCGYQPAVLLRFGEELLKRLEARRGHHENLVVTPDDVAETFHQQPVQDEIRRVVSCNFQSNPVGRAVFAALLLEFASLPRGQGLRRAEERVLERLRSLDEEAPVLLRGDDPSALGQVTYQLKDFVKRKLLLERYEQGDPVYFLEFPYHLSVLLVNDQQADIHTSLMALRNGAGRPATEVRGLLPPRILNALRDVVRPGPKGPDPDLPCRAAVIGTLWPDAINNRSRGVASSLGLDPSAVVRPGEPRPGEIANRTILAVQGASVEDLESITGARPAGLPAPLFTGGADLLREALRRSRRGSDFYEVYGLARLGLPAVRWWFQRVRGLEFPGEADLAEVHRLAGGIPLLVRAFDDLLSGGGATGGYNVSQEEVVRVQADFTRKIPNIARNLVAGPPAGRLTPREIDLLRMVHTVNAALDFHAEGTNFEEALGAGWMDLYAEEWPKRYPNRPVPEPVLETTEDQLSLSLLAFLGLLPARREGLSAAARLEPLPAGDPLLELLHHLRDES